MSVKLDYVMDELLAARKLWDTTRFREIAVMDTIPEKDATKQDVENAVRILSAERRILESPDIFFVEPDMHRLILAAMETFEPEPLLSTDLITPTGYVRLPEAIEVPAAADSPEGFKALNVEGEEGYLPQHSAFGWERQGLASEEENSIIERLTGEGILLTYFHTNNDFPAIPVGLYPGRYIGWPLVDTLDVSEQIVVNWHPAYLYPRVFFRLVMQRLTEVVAQPPVAREVRRRHKREGYELPRYSVIRLRRHSRPSAKNDEEERKWRLNYRTVTRGHWRQQWYPSIQQHRQIWIDDFIRGPEDAELVIRPRIFDVRD
jgi:hypothetical protein